MTAYKNCYGEEIDLLGEQARRSVPKGYRGIPGTGPEGETCGSCGNRVTNQHQRKYYKCGLTKWTNGAATDIRLKSPACSFWRQQE